MIQKSSAPLHCLALSNVLVNVLFSLGGASTSGQTHREGLAKALDSPMERQSSSAMGWALEATSVNADMRHPEDVINPSPAKMLPSLPTHTPNRTGGIASISFPCCLLVAQSILWYTRLPAW